MEIRGQRMASDMSQDLISADKRRFAETKIFFRERYDVFTNEIASFEEKVNGYRNFMVGEGAKARIRAEESLLRNGKIIKLHFAHIADVLEEYDSVMLTTDERAGSVWNS